MTGTVLDILIYVFDRYMLDEAPEVPERETLARDLTSAGFGEANVERALDWLADLAGERDRLPFMPESGRQSPAGSEAADAAAAEMPAEGKLRIYASSEIARLDAETRGLLLSLELGGILSPLQREIVIERLLALDDDFDLEQVKWVVLMVLSSQPGQEQACARMEDLVFESPAVAVH